MVVIVSLIVGNKAYKQYYKLPLEQEAQESCFQAQYYFEQESFDLALNGDGNNYGFIKIADEYSNTKAGNLSNYYSGLCQLRLKKYDKAIESLKKFDTTNKLFKSLSLGLIGDAFAEKNNLKEALNYYKNSASVGNSFTSPKFLMKASLIAKKLNNKSEAILIYEQIKNEYPKSFEAKNIEKLIEVLK